MSVMGTGHSAFRFLLPNPGSLVSKIDAQPPNLDDLQSHNGPELQ